jgi:hypothetical protein
MPVTSNTRWAVAAVVLAAIIALLAWARHDAGVDDRVPDPEDAIAVVLVEHVASVA